MQEIANPTKLAILFSGLPRMKHRSTEMWLNVIKKYNADVFVHTWDIGNQHEIDRMLEIYNPTSFRVDKQIEINEAPYIRLAPPDINVFNTLSSWHSAKRVFGVASTYYQQCAIKPDIVIKTRFDYFSADLNLLKVSTLVIPMDPFKSPGCFHFKRQFMPSQQDVLCYGTMEQIGVYCEMIDHIDTVIEEDPSIPFISEYLLSAYLWWRVMPYYSHVVPYELDRIDLLHNT